MTIITKTFSTRKIMNMPLANRPSFDLENRQRIHHHMLHINLFQNEN
jgi:hypothetical protein